MDRGAEVMLEAGQRQLGRASAATERRLSFENDDGAAFLRDGDRGGQAIGAGADDDGVVGRAWEMQGVGIRRSGFSGQTTRRHGDKGNEEISCNRRGGRSLAEWG